MIIVVPTGYGAVNCRPSLRTPDTVTPGQLSVALATPGFTVAEHNPGVLPTVIFIGQVIVGAWVSLTVTEKLQVAWLPPTSVAVQVTWVVPTGKNEPEDGEQVAVAPGVLSLTCGFG